MNGTSTSSPSHVWSYGIVKPLTLTAVLDNPKNSENKAGHSRVPDSSSSLLYHNWKDKLLSSDVEGFC